MAVLQPCVPTKPIAGRRWRENHLPRRNVCPCALEYAAFDAPASALGPNVAVRLSAAGEKAVKSGHPWVWESSIASVSRDDARAGDLAVIFDNKKQRFLAVGLWDPGSPLRVRILHSGKARKVDGDLWGERAAQSHALREGIARKGVTTAYRRINGESDGFPGLVVDRYGDTDVAKVYTAAWLPHLGSVLPAACQGAGRVVLRLSDNAKEAAAAWGVGDGDVVAGEPLGEDGTVIFLENGLKFEANVRMGQKTGFFLDQRDNRARVERLFRDRPGGTCLNTFSFSGGFSLYAARGGAFRVVSVDISDHAIASARRNFGLNGDDDAVRSCAHEGVQEDCFQFLARKGEPFDVVITDPPSMARRKKDVSGALRAYYKLAQTGVGRVKAGGTLVAASCSAHVTEEEFLATVVAGAKAGAGGKAVRVVEVMGHAADHPVAIPEMAYLKCVLMRVG